MRPKRSSGRSVVDMNLSEKGKQQVKQWKADNAARDGDPHRDHKACFGTDEIPDCRFAKSYVTWWCASHDACEFRRTSFLATYNCAFYEPRPKSESGTQHLDRSIEIVDEGIAMANAALVVLIATPVLICVIMLLFCAIMFLIGWIR